MITVTDAAADQILKLIEKHYAHARGLRVGVKAGGCSGLSYVFAWEPTAQPGDEVFEGPERSRVFVDPKSHRFLDGTTLDYDTGLVSKGFTFENPRARSTCGCGTSFSLS